MRASASYAALAQAVAPPGGDARAFAALGLPEPDAVALEAEHVVLFGRAGRARISPYEGVRVGGDLHAILGDYSRAGFAPDPSFRDRWDHVCVGLAVLSALSESAERAGAAGGPEARPAEEMLRAFFRRRVQPWVPAFFADLAAVPHHPLHRALGIRGGELLREEVARLGEAEPRRQERGPLQEPRCTQCGEPVGFSLPKRNDVLPPWGLVCLRCRVRADLGRSGT